MIFIDCREQYVSVMEEIIMTELHVGGWHLVQTEHHFLHNNIKNYEICVQKETKKKTFSVQAKQFIGGGIRPEHESVMKLKRKK